MFVVGVLGALWLMWRFVPRVFLPIANPIVRTAHRVGDMLESPLAFVRYGESARDRELVREYAHALEVLRLEHEVVVAENALLRNELGLREVDTEGDVSIAVLSYPPITPFDFILLDGGTRDGITEGARVFAGNRVLMGTIDTVSHTTSLMSLLTTPERKTEGVLVRSGTAVVLEGVGGGAFEFVAPEGFNVEVGELITTPGSERYVIGRVVSIEADDNGTFRTVFIEQPVNMRNIQWVRINQNNQ